MILKYIKFRPYFVLSRWSSQSTQGKQKAKKSANNKYSDTVHLPRTEFPLRLDGAKRVDRDHWIEQKSGFDGLYDWQRTHCTGTEFVLHDGPPYSNGSPHVGHAVNKILKDITIRHKVIRGHKIHYQPGWDCHGLPIELRAINAGSADTKSPLDVRKAAQKFAVESAATQLAAFKRWGVLADWNNPYFTFDVGYVTKQLDAFYELYKKGYVYRDLKPVYWSPSTKTALAEAELEYNPSHRSNAIYVEFHSVDLPPQITSILPSSVTTVCSVIWTTTPWTLPANCAVCYSSSATYSLFNVGDEKKWYVVASQVLPDVAEKLGWIVKDKQEISGAMLHGMTYRHPVYSDRVLPLLPGKHVTMDKGSGLVHIAPAHGPDDYLVALENNIPMECMVDECGCYTELAGPHLQGIDVIGDADNVVTDLLGGNVLHKENFIHSYPYDWRSKKPVIVRSSMQWFVDTEKTRSEALKCLADVAIIPSTFENGMVNQLIRRPYWCISRQRAWGVPIPAFYNRDGKAHVTEHSIKRIKDLMQEHGPDVWWTMPATELLGTDQTDLEKGEDIMDIWFDSGISWAAVLDGKIADLCVEGPDQFRGWFQSSLLLSVALQGTAPYKSLFVHGFTMDEKGHKMSKSVGNVIDPQTITDGGINLKKEPACGADVLRWWVAHHATGHANILLGPSIVQSSAENVHKIRIVLRFLLGALHEFQQDDAVAWEDMRPLDQYMLFLLHGFCNKVSEHFDNYQYNKACAAILSFVTNDMSSFYCHLIKDRLYCDVAHSLQRRSCQTALDHLLVVFTKMVAPVMPHLAEEVFLHHPIYEEIGAFKSPLDVRSEWEKPFLLDNMALVLQLRQAVNKLGHGTKIAQHDLHIHTKGNSLSLLKALQKDETSCHSDLCELMQVAHVTLSDKPCDSAVYESVENVDIALVPSKTNRCCRCRRFIALDQPLCERCLLVLSK